jgi:integrase
MARPKDIAPSMRYHLSGQAVVTLGGKDFYLGKHNSSEAIARYAVLIAEYQRAGLTLSEDFDQKALFAKADALIDPSPRIAHERQENEPIRVKDVAECFRSFASTRFAFQYQELSRVNRLCDELIELYGDDLAVDFGPKRLKQMQRRWVSKDLSRPYVNRLVKLVRRMFKYAVSEELIAAETHRRLQTVEALRFGATEAREPELRQPVPLDHVRKTAAELSPILKDMLRVLLGTGMRPSEVCTMRACDIDRTGDIWFYRPKRHKTAGKGKVKSVPLLNDAREAVTDYLNRPANAYLFSPIESMAWFRAKQRAERKTRVQPSQLHRRKDAPLKQPGEFFDSNAFRQSIQRACIRAGVKPWTPYQIRHMVASEVRQALGLEQTQALLGHHHRSMTEHYARLAETQAVEAAKVAPKL